MTFCEKPLLTCLQGIDMYNNNLWNFLTFHWISYSNKNQKVRFSNVQFKTFCTFCAYLKNDECMRLCMLFVNTLTIHTVYDFKAFNSLE